MRWLFILLTGLLLYGCDHHVSSKDWDMPKVSVKKSHLPNFKGVGLDQRKQKFNTYLLPMVNQLNELQLKKRQLLVRAHKYFKQHDFLPPRSKKFIISLAKQFSVDIDQGIKLTTFTTLLNRVDVIPPNLVMAQAANESAWGSSRFARKANNLFGQWCYRSGCGVVPLNRREGATHEVKKFKSPFQSLAAYMRNLNTNPAYRKLREIRANLRQRNQPITGQILAQGLKNYSARGQSYVDSLRKLMNAYDEDWPARVSSLEHKK